MDENTMVGQVFKARCFTKGNFLNAKLGNIPSYIWKSIIEAQNLVKQGAMRRVGLGLNINTIDEPWLPDTKRTFVTSCHVGLEGEKVASLMAIG